MTVANTDIAAVIRQLPPARLNVTREIRENFETISSALDAGRTRTEIARALGIRPNTFIQAYRLEARRRRGAKAA